MTDVSSISGIEGTAPTAAAARQVGTPVWIMQVGVLAGR
jgi:hypothetical protein